MSQKIQSHRDLLVYQKAFASAMEVFELSKSFPKEETYSLTDQIRRSSRSVCGNLAEAWRKRRYQAAFHQQAIRFRKRSGRNSGLDRIRGKMQLHEPRPSRDSLP
jgi:hypothetical protein